jgi:hypothetical protein
VLLSLYTAQIGRACPRKRCELIQASRSITRAFSANAKSFAIVPICVKTIQIDRTTITGDRTAITGAPPVLEFEKDFLPPPANAGEGFASETPGSKSLTMKYYSKPRVQPVPSFFNLKN